MELLLSWSGQASHDLAVFLREWLTEVIPGCKPWVSSEDIAKGKRWSDELHAQLGTCKVSVICITPQNARSPWLYYEAGFIAAKFSEATVCPYLVGVPGKLVKDTPLGLYQWTVADKTDTLKLIRDLHKLLGSPHDPGMLEGNFQSKWPQLKRRLDKIAEEFPEIEDVVEQIEPPLSQQLTQEARELLRAACESNGDIANFAYLGGHEIQAGNRQFVEQENPRSLALWESVLDELLHFGLIKDRGYKRELFQVTRLGWEVCDLIRATDTKGKPESGGQPAT